MKFEYKKLSLDRRSEFFGNSVLKPIIPIRVSHQKNSLQYEALIDSGADFCIFDAEIGEALGLDVSAGKYEGFGGIQDRTGAVAYFHDVTLNIGGWDYKTTVGFSYDIAKWGHGILGQKGFFDMFSIKFDYQKEDIEIKEKR